MKADYTLEVALIGSLIQYGQAGVATALGAGFAPELCRRPQHQDIVRWILSRAEAGEGTDLEVLISAVERANLDSLSIREAILLICEAPSKAPILEAVAGVALELRAAWVADQTDLLQKRLQKAIKQDDAAEIARISRQLLTLVEPKKVARVRSAPETTGDDKPDPAVLTKLRTLGKAKTDPRVRAYEVLRRDPRWIGHIWLDLWRDRLMLGTRLYQDQDDANIALWLSRVYGIRIAAGSLKEIAKTLGRDQGRDPLLMELERVAWDGTPRLIWWLQKGLGVADSDLIRSIGKKWAIQAVKRATDPGCQADATLCLVGAQGKYKSSVIEALAGKEFYSDSPLEIDRDMVRVQQQINAAWIHDFAEGADTRRAEVNKLKGFLTRRNDVFIPKHGHHVKDQPRRCVFVETTNDDRLIPDDPSGARRFWPAYCTQGNPAWVAANRDQLWAEALVYARKGEQYWLTDAEVIELLEHQEDFQQDDSVLSAVRRWLRDPDTKRNYWVAGEREGRNPLTTETLILGPMAHEKKDLVKRALEQRAGDILRKLGYRRKRVRTEEHLDYGYVPIEGDQDDP